jgi:ABC-type Fe3+-hydroxamate transport system substrate-binding protein
MKVTDFTFTEIDVPAPARRVVSLVPSITESVFALGAGAALLGRTRYCISPAEHVKAVENIGGTKDPDVARIIAIKPDLVLANKEENRREDILHLREHGLTVYVDYTTTVEESLALVSTLGRMLGRESEAEPFVRAGAKAIVAARERVRELTEQNSLRMNPRPSALPGVIAFVWKDPWMAVGRETYAGDVIETLGGRNLLKEEKERYLQITPERVAELQPDILLFPDEPFHFKPPHLDWWVQNFPKLPAVQQGRLRICDGQDFCWLGTRTPEALRRLAGLCAW